MPHRGNGHSIGLPTLQLAYWKLPSSIPSLQYLVSEAQTDPYPTVLSAYAKTVSPCLTAVPHGVVQALTCQTVHVFAVNVPSRRPSRQVLVSDSQN